MAPNFDPSAYHMLICGVPGVAFEQNGCYYNVRHDYVKPSGRKRAANLAANLSAVQRPTSVATVVGALALAGTVPDSVQSLSNENEKAARAEQAAD